MGLAIGVLGLMLAMRRLGFRSTLAYVLPAVVFWVAMLKSGVHATIAGVILGAITPAKSSGRRKHLRGDGAGDLAGLARLAGPGRLGAERGHARAH